MLIKNELLICKFPQYFSYQCENQWTPPQNIFLASKQLDSNTESYNLPNTRSTDFVDAYIDPMEKYNISESANNFVGGGNSGGTCGLSSLKSFSSGFASVQQLPEFPDYEGFSRFLDANISEERFQSLLTMYRAHSQRIMDSINKFSFVEVRPRHSSSIV